MPAALLVPDPSTLTADMYFNTGQVVNSQAVFNAELPPVPGPINTSWDLTCWGKQEWIDPTVLAATNTLGTDQTLGLPEYLWDTPDLKTVFGIYNSSQYGSVYDIYSANGSGNLQGGACVFLSTMSLPPTSMDHLINFTMQAKIGQAIGTSGDGTAAAETGFSFNYSEGATNYTLFLQFAIADANGTPGLYQNTSGNTFIFDADYPQNEYLSYAPDSGPLHFFSYNLNTALVAAIDYIASSTGVSVASLDNLQDWTLTGSYVGTEVETTGGNIGLGLDVANVDLTSGPAQSFTGQDVSSSVAGTYEINTDGSGQLVAPTEDGEVLINSTGNDTINCGSANITVSASGRSVQVDGGPGAVNVTSSNDLTFVGGAGDATLNATGIVSIAGGTGTIYITTGSSSSLELSGGAGAETIYAGGSCSVYGGAGALYCHTGTAGHSVVVAGAGDSTLVAGGNQDTIFGGAGSCTITGHENDVLVAGKGQAEISAAANDTVYGSAGCSILGSGSNTIVGGGGEETIRAGGDGSVIWTTSSSANTVVGGSGNELIATFGATGADLIECEGGSYDVFAGAGDTVLGGAGTSTIVLQDDATIHCGTGATSLFCRDGNQVFSGASAASDLTATIDGTGNVLNFGTETSQIWNSAAGNTFVFNEADVCSVTIWSVDFAKDEFSFNGFSGAPVASEVRTSTGAQITLTNGTEISAINATNVNLTSSWVVPGG